ncbi:MAG: hypothetical protein PWR13_767 [Archaeoglobi archaeon]|nr:hypothetical protein [Archaeoglobi archaeon]
MEEVYGWDLEELQRRIQEDEEKVYYWYFPIGYICHVVREAESKSGPDARRKIEDLFKEIPEAPQVSDKYELFEKAWEWLLSKEHLIGKTPKKDEPRIKLSWSRKYRILTNFPLFQPGLNVERQKTIFLEILGLKKIEEELLIYIEKTVSKFLPSKSEFPNVPYTKSCITINNMLSLTPKALIFVLTYPVAFISEREILELLGYSAREISKLEPLKYWIMFYSPELKFAYNVNKKLRMYIEKYYKGKKREKNNKKAQDIFRITLRSVTDSLTEVKSIWSLENMYFIEIEPPKGQKQDFENVEYIGIPKLQASIVIDDTLRNALNKYIPIRESKGKIENVWILEEFIKNKPLLSYLIHHIHLILADRISKKYYAGVKSLIYASIVDAKIREFGKSNRLFEEDFFERYRGILTEIKEDAHWAFGISRIFKDLFEDFDERKSYANILLSMIKRSDKYRIVNTLLKTLIDKKADIKNVKNLVNFVFSKILPNDRSWKNYALVFVIGLVGRGDADGDEE